MFLLSKTRWGAEVVGNILTFVREARAELKKVTWPGKKQVWYSTIVVIAFTLLVSAYLGIVDMVLTGVFSRLFS
ncbi:MAG: preprotein translocase subunit SecE [Synergistetes bacterium HGW-Synergistetes-2]|nr:MAG: preprotein translocase subunit SecE [Synergistetes bacterium HGW-Synergistetes-2]